MCSTPDIFMSWLLKYLYLDFSSNVVILLALFLFVISFAFACSLKDRGEPVSANQSITMLLNLVFTQHSPPASLLNVMLFYSSVPLVLLCSLMTSLPLILLCRVRPLRQLFPLLFTLLRRTFLVLSHVELFLFEGCFVVCFFCSLV